MLSLWMTCAKVGAKLVQNSKKLYSQSTAMIMLGGIAQSCALLLHTLSTRFSTRDYMHFTGVNFQLYPLSTEPITTTTLI